MSSKMNSADRVVREAEPLIKDIVEQEGMELVDLVYRNESHGWVLRVLVDKEGGVTLEDCSFVSHQIGDVLDVKDVVRHAFNLEVSSPGINRPLKKEKDFLRVIGETVRVKTSKALESRRNFKGRLIRCADATVFIEIDGNEYAVPLRLIDRANLEFDFTKSNKQKK